MISRTFISEIDVNRIKPGQKAEINVDAFPLKSYTGTVLSVANIGEELTNSDSKVFETQIRINGIDPEIRPSMTTGNKIIITTSGNVVYVPTECIQSGADSISFVYTKNRQKQVVLTGTSNEKNTVIEKGLKAGTMIYLSMPQNPEKFRLGGKDLIPELKQKYRTNSSIAENK
jgi:HlyD family secretion protein